MSGQLRFDVYNGLDLLATLDNAFDKEAKAEFNGPGYGKFSLAKDDANANQTILAQGNTVRVYDEDNDTGNADIEFFLESGDFDLISHDEDGGQNLHFSGPGTLTYLQRAVLDFVQYLGTTQLVFPMEHVHRWDTETEGDIIRRIIDECQNRDNSGEGIFRTGGFRPSDPIPLLERTFDAAVDTDGTSWGDEALEGNYTADIGNTAYNEVLKFAQMGFIQVEMEPGYIFDARRNDRGDADKTGSIRFEKGVNISTDLTRRAPGKVYASDAIVQGDGLYARAGITPIDGLVKEVFVEVSSDTEATLIRGGEGLLGFRQDAQEAISIAATVPLPGAGTDATTFRPGPHWTGGGQYWIGDKVTLHTGTGEYDYNETPLYVVGITLMEDETGAVAPPILELGGPFAPLPDAFPSATPGLVGHDEFWEYGGQDGGLETMRMRDFGTGFFEEMAASHGIFNDTDARISMRADPGTNYSDIDIMAYTENVDVFAEINLNSGSIVETASASWEADVSGSLDISKHYFIGGWGIVFDQDLTADPAGGASQEGQVYWNTSTKTLRWFDGTTWDDLGSGGGGGGGGGAGFTLASPYVRFAATYTKLAQEDTGTVGELRLDSGYVKLEADENDGNLAGIDMGGGTGELNIWTHGSDLTLLPGNGTATTERVVISGGLGLVFPGLAADPTGTAGLVYFNTSSNTFRGYDGTAWGELPLI